MWSSIRVPVFGTTGLCSTGVGVKKGCAKRKTGLGFALDLDRLLGGIVLLFGLLVVLPIRAAARVLSMKRDTSYPKQKH